MNYDITFVGHMCYDEVEYHDKPGYIAPGSAVLCGAAVAARVGKKVALVTRLAEKDRHILEELEKLGVDCYVSFSEETSRMLVKHPGDNVDEREMVLKKDAGPFQPEDFPDLNSAIVHLAGISNREFSLEFMGWLKQKAYPLSVDMQSFVRQADPETGVVSFRDDQRKKNIVALMQKVKLDVVEAKLLTGTDELERAAGIISSWGCPEVLITKAEGALLWTNGTVMFEKFSNRSDVGRTGRGDTTFAAYLSARQEKDPAWALKFAASLVSLKMEKTGPYRGSLDDALRRMEEDQRF